MQELLRCHIIEANEICETFGKRVGNSRHGEKGVPNKQDTATTTKKG